MSEPGFVPSKEAYPETFDYHIEGGVLFDGEGKPVDYRAAFAAREDFARTAVVKALRKAAQAAPLWPSELRERADSIENGADW